MIESPLMSEDWPLTLEEDLELFLHIAHAQFDDDPTNPLPAFHAIAYVRSYYEQAQIELPANIEIPSWIIDVIAKGYWIYGESWEDKSGTPFGKALGIEGGGRGKGPRIKKYQKKMRDIRVATLIALRKESGVKIEAAIEEAAAATGRDHKTMYAIWGDHKDHAHAALKRLRAIQAQKS